MKPSLIGNMPLVMETCSIRCLLGFAALGFFLIGEGCASTNTQASGPRPRDGIAEYRQVAVEAKKVMQGSLNSLAAVSAQSNRCAPDVLAAFSAATQRLQVESIPLRERAQAMQARGDAYFDQWEKRVAQVKDPAVRAAAEREHPRLEESFHQIKTISQEAREAFGPFQASLRKVRNALETDPANVSANPTRDQIASAKQSGEHVQQCLDRIIAELDSMRAMLTPPGVSAQSPQAR
jgi:hypothetical protein